METLTALLSLTFMEIVLGIDNIIFIAILSGRLPPDKRPQARKLGIAFALVTRLLLLFSISWIMGLTEPLFTLFQREISVRDLILLGGGLFLIGKATKEIHDKVEDIHSNSADLAPATSVVSIVIQIMFLDIVFSLDSVITAVGMAQELWIMVTAMIVSMIVMLISARGISDFVEKHPTIKILALSFLILIGVFLTLEGMGAHVDKNYIYFAMFFSLTIELINMRYRVKKKVKTK